MKMHTAGPEGPTDMAAMNVRAKALTYYLKQIFRGNCG